jgi:hypothetical protein
MEVSDKVQRRINYLNYYHLEKLANWCWKRYAKGNGFVKMPPIAHYITSLHYHLEEGRAGLL